MKDTVVLFGTNTFTRHLIDWTRTDCEFWAWNEVGSLRDDRSDYWAKRVDLLLQLHAPPIWRNPKNLNHAGHYEWLKRPHEYPIYMQEKYEDVPSSVRYPKEEIVNKLLSNLVREVKAGKEEQIELFTSSFDYAVALALYLGKKRIDIYGVEMTSDTEYVRQRPGGYFWLGQAGGRGLKVVIHSPLLMSDKLYGYTGEVVIHRQEFEMSQRKLETMVEEEKNKATEASGRTQAMLDALLKVTDYGALINEFFADMSKITDPAQAQARANLFLSAFNQSQVNAQKISSEFLRCMNDSQTAAAGFGILQGRYMENSRYVAECDELIKAAGGEKALQVLMNVEAVSG